MGILFKNLNCGLKPKFWSKNKSVVKHRHFGQRSPIWSKICILLKNLNSGQKPNFWSKIKIVVKNKQFGQKWDFIQKCTNVIMVKNL